MSKLLNEFGDERLNRKKIKKENACHKPWTQIYGDLILAVFAVSIWLIQHFVLKQKNEKLPKTVIKIVKAIPANA